MIQAGCRCGARGFILPFIGVASIICLLVRESSISCLLVRVTVTEGTHPTPRTIMTEIVPQRARRTAEIHIWRTSAARPKARGGRRAWRRPRGVICAAPTAHVTPRDALAVRNRMPAHWALPEILDAGQTGSEVPADEPHAGSPLNAYQAFLRHRNW